VRPCVWPDCPNTGAGLGGSGLCSSHWGSLTSEQRFRIGEAWRTRGAARDAFRYVEVNRQPKRAVYRALFRAAWYAHRTLCVAGYAEGHRADLAANA
jgi:hypothetical protein